MFSSTTSLVLTIMFFIVVLYFIIKKMFKFILIALVAFGGYLAYLKFSKKEAVIKKIEKNKSSLKLNSIPLL